jgi:hypothetical protein
MGQAVLCLINSRKGPLVRAGVARSHHFPPQFYKMYVERNAYRILVGNPEGKRPLGRPRRRWVDNIKIDLREIG